MSRYDAFKARLHQYLRGNNTNFLSQKATQSIQCTETLCCYRLMTSSLTHWMQTVGISLQLIAQQPAMLSILSFTEDRFGLCSEAGPLVF